MSKNIEKMLRIASDAETISPDDDLSRLIKKETNDELTEFELDEVAAAAKPNFEEFLRRLDASK